MCTLMMVGDVVNLCIIYMIKYKCTDAMLEQATGSFISENI